MVFQTEFEFILPKGFMDSDGNLINTGCMRLAIAQDEIQVLNDPRVLENDAYLPIVLLSRVIIRLGNTNNIPPELIENLFAADIAYLEDLYLRINNPEPIFLRAICPRCNHNFQLQVAPLES